MIPVARTEKLLIQQVGNEVIIYDQISNISHCLNPIAAKVWHYCDGQHSVKEIAKLLEKDLPQAVSQEVDMRGLVWLTLEELEKYQLIKEYLKQPIISSIVSRRTVIKTSALVGGFALGSMFPFVRSIAVAEPGKSQSTTKNPSPSPNCVEEGGKCGSSAGGATCCAGLSCLNSSPNGSGNERTCQKPINLP